jgi:monoamine oxidase
VEPFECIIIGAGAAGLAAAQHFRNSNRVGGLLILEARDRIGGRIHTDNEFADYPIELGAEFIHGDNASTHQLVQQADLHTIPVERMGNLFWGLNHQAAVHHKSLPAPLHSTFDRLLNDYAKLYSNDLPTDMPLANWLRSHGWSGADLDMADVLLAQTCCASIETLSCHDLIREHQNDTAGDGEARIREGYDALLHWYSRDLPIRFNTKVDRIGQHTVSAGDETFQAHTIIVTLPVSLLQRGDITFETPLSAAKQQAIQDFRIEPATKLIYRFHEQFWDDSLTYMAHTGTTARWWTPGYQRGGNPVITAFVTADRARQIDALSETDAINLGLHELSGLLGQPENRLHERLVKARRVSWAADPYARGGYAHIPPGKAAAREILAQPEWKGSLLFAGEATAYDSNPQTVHGALESGHRAAQQAAITLAQLG